MNHLSLKALRSTSGLLLLASFTASVYAQQEQAVLNNSGAVIASMSAAQAVVAGMHDDALSERLGAVRLSSADRGGVWISYFGGVSRNTSDTDISNFDIEDAAFRLHTNGVMLGGDTLIGAENGHWLAGLAVSAARSHLTTRGHSHCDCDVLQTNNGDIKSYGMHGYLSRQYDNGVYVDTSLVIYHLSNSATIKHGVNTALDYSVNGFGGAVKVGYHYLNSGGLFAEPYARVSAKTFESAGYEFAEEDDYASVHNEASNSVRGEIGGKLGMKLPVHNAEVSPYLQAAFTNEFAGRNKFHARNGEGLESVSVKTDGAAVRMGAGVQASLTKNAGAYASLSYLKGEHREEPLQG
ncbi:autotransporter outer membrane beta-barrel domain-containing protein, partial [Enterobacter ludwigii]|uniref:autotransporter outer membrane beta-barrel domain-containing protein n=1 Tax=Enterobacter ludwigii TaxID=299767 RepID=UPI003976CEE7